MIRSVDNFELYLFYTETTLTQHCVQDGVDGVIVDWEHKGKHLRQEMYNTEINKHTLEDLITVKKNISANTICRINAFEHLGENEIENTIAAGASEILLPMVTSPKEVEQVLRIIDGRCALGILVETEKAVAQARDLGTLPLSRAYVGLNDLTIERGSNNIFLPLADGTVEEVRQHFDIPFGFGGLTDPSMGTLLPCQMLINEMTRLSCSFSFLRRSFLRDIKLLGHQQVISNIKQALKSASEKDILTKTQDHQEMLEMVGNITANAI